MCMDEKKTENFSKFQIIGAIKMMLRYSSDDFFHFDLGFVVLFVIYTSTPEHTHIQALLGD